jgi:hypothetical protein
MVKCPVVCSFILWLLCVYLTLYVASTFSVWLNLPILTTNVHVWDLCTAFFFFKKLATIYEMWYKRYYTRLHYSVSPFILMKSVIKTWGMRATRFTISELIMVMLCRGPSDVAFWRTKNKNMVTEYSFNLYFFTVVTCGSLGLGIRYFVFE